MLPKINDAAPAFSLPDEDGKIHKLEDFRGKKLLLYFYPKDDTSGCTLEACNFRDDYSEYVKADITILGVSPDSQQSHQKFKGKNNLPFPLLADEGHIVCEKYGVWGRKKMMGNEYDGVFRTTFLIDENSKILNVFENVKPADHSKEILATIK
jgi:peroxiredoxin Q/BCP